AERPADNYGELGNRRRSHSVDHLRTVLGNSGLFVFLSHHEADDVLQEYQRDAAPVAQLDEVRAFLRGFREQDAIVRDDADRVSVQVRETAHQGRTVQRLELLELRTIHQPRDNFPDVVGETEIARNDAVQLLGRIRGFCRFAKL